MTSVKVAATPTSKAATISVNGFDGSIDFKNHTVNIQLGDIAGVYSSINIPEFAKAAFKKYPQYKICKIQYELVVAHRDEKFTEVYKHTPEGIKKIGETMYS